MKAIRRRLTYANVASSLALFLVLGGTTALAASHLGKNSVGSKQLKPNSVTTAKLKKNAVTAGKIEANSIAAEELRDGAVTGAKVDLSTLGTVPSAASAATFGGYNRRGIVRATAAPAGATLEATVAAAPELPLFSAAPFTVYAKCVDFGALTRGFVFIRTSEAGAIFDSDTDGAEGEPFLDPGTQELDREVLNEAATANDAGYWGVHAPELSAMAPSGTALRGDVQIAVKQGSLPGGNGIFGAGNVCLFAGEATALNG